jgi:hypothetical protein
MAFKHRSLAIFTSWVDIDSLGVKCFEAGYCLQRPHFIGEGGPICRQVHTLVGHVIWGVVWFAAGETANDGIRMSLPTNKYAIWL